MVCLFHVQFSYFELTGNIRSRSIISNNDLQYANLFYIRYLSKNTKVPLFNSFQCLKHLIVLNWLNNVSKFGNISIGENNGDL